MINLGQTRVSLEQRELFKDGAALRVGARAFDILELLIRCQGRLVTKDEILHCVWPQTVVEENNLQVHISALRKALGDDRDLIRTIAGRGYVLLGAGGPEPDVASARAFGQKPLQTESMLPASAPLIGRELLFNEVCQALSVRALVTLTGPGGVGKTALATEVAQCFVTTQAASVYFVSLAELNGPVLLMEAMANALGIDCADADPTLETLVTHLAGQPCLIVLDNCEHMIEAVASLVEALIHQCSSLTLLATSREPLRIAHERSVRVPALQLPEAGADRESILASASVRLFSMHMRALDGTVAHRRLCPDADSTLDDQSIELMGQICRRLEGQPLALQMAAARACGLGLYELIGSLDDNLHLLSSGLRTAPARHQTLQASLIWSLRLLEDDELAVLERLSQVQGRFTLDLACDAVQGRDIPRSRVLDCIIGLALKSLLNVTADGPFRLYSVPASTRAFIKCALQGPTQTLPPNLDGALAHKHASGLSLADFQSGTSGPAGPNGYHARHQRVLAASQ